MKALDGINVLNLALNLPGPVAAARLVTLGAKVTKIEPPDGDQLARGCNSLYKHLHQGQQILNLNLKDASGQAQLGEHLQTSDLLMTAFRPSALDRLGLSWPGLHERYPRLCQVAIVGHASPDAEQPGHDLNYLASAGLLTPPQVPPMCVADFAGGDRAVSAALELILARERGQGSGFKEVSLAGAAEDFAITLRHGLTAPTGLLGGAFPGYQLYRARQGWVSVAALEMRFWQRLGEEFGQSNLTKEGLARVFLERTADEWQAWASERDLPIVAVVSFSGNP